MAAVCIIPGLKHKDRFSHDTVYIRLSDMTFGQKKTETLAFQHYIGRNQSRGLTN